jgi:DNA-binding XRE family transcriptional regulator
MSAATKTHPIKLTFRSGTPRRILQDARRRYSRYLVEREDKAVDYFETDLAKKIEASMTPGLWLKHLREAHNLSQAELGEKIGGIKPSRISDWENNQRAVSKAAAKSLAKLFRVPADRFI